MHGIDRAGEVGDHAVPGGVEDAASVRRDQPVDDSPQAFSRSSVATSSRAINRL